LTQVHAAIEIHRRDRLHPRHRGWGWGGVHIQRCFRCRGINAAQRLRAIAL
jgi:hypothetical protein